MAFRAGVVIAAALAVLAPSCGDGDDDASTTPSTAPDRSETISVTVLDGEVSGVGDRVSVELDTEVTLVVDADTSDHVHVHGYDLVADVAPGSPATIEFTADLAGVWEVELENAGQLLFQLEVA